GLALVEQLPGFDEEKLLFIECDHQPITATGPGADVFVRSAVDLLDCGSVAADVLGMDFLQSEDGGGRQLAELPGDHGRIRPSALDIPGGDGELRLSRGSGEQVTRA